MLQRRPYISVAQALECMHKNFLSATGLTPEQVAPFDFTLLKTRPNGRVTFRWILGHDQQKFLNILSHKETFCQLAGLVSQNIGRRKPRLAEYYKSVLENPATSPDLDFITAVFHLTFRFQVPAEFNTGLIHKKHCQVNAPYYCARLCNQQRGLADIPLLQIGDEAPREQVSPEFYRGDFQRYRAFYEEWICTIQGFSLHKEKQDYKHPYILYFPVYDGVLPTQRALRGYLGIFCLNAATRAKALAYFEAQTPHIFNSINVAYKKGAYNNIVDNYPRSGKTPNPLEYWRDNISSLHHWGLISIETDPRESELFFVEDGKCKISLVKLLTRRDIEKYVDDDLLYKYHDKVLSLVVPPEVIQPDSLSIESAYLRKRIREICQLFDELLRVRYTFRESRKSAVATVMSRNMAHSLGSHVFARICSNGNLEGLFKLDREKLNAFHAYIRTRMDFLANLTTTPPAVTASLKVYRDTLGYFKPVFADQECLVWQELLLDFISGTDDIDAAKIDIHYDRDGEKISLERPDLDLVFASPNGLLGTHALYIILENVIRNSAKHVYNAGRHAHLDLVFQINRITPKGELIEVCVCDQLEDVARLVNVNGTVQRLIDYLNQKIDESILDASGKLRPDAWGLLEMKICAAFLRRIPTELLDIDHDPPLLEAISINGKLGYRFYLTVPKEVLIVDQKGQIPNKAGLNRKLSLQGSKIVDIPGFKQELQSNIQHHFLILVDPTNVFLNEIEHHLTALPTRILTTNPAITKYPCIPLPRLKGYLQEAVQRHTTLFSNVWRYWLKLKNERAALFIRLDNEKNISKWQIEGFSDAAEESEKILRFKPDKNYIIYDRHGVIFQKYRDVLEPKLHSGQIIYYEPVDYNHPTQFVIDNAVENLHLNPVQVYKLIECGLTRIIILDERIQKSVEERSEKGEKLTKLLRYLNIIVPPKSKLDLDHPQLVSRKLKRWVDDTLKNAGRMNVFVVVHLGILEKIFKKNLEVMRRYIQRYQESYPAVNILIISGRGLPYEIRELQTRFIQYSQVARYVLEERSKYHLCKVLYAARRALL